MHVYTCNLKKLIQQVHSSEKQHSFFLSSLPLQIKSYDTNNNYEDKDISIFIMKGIKECTKYSLYPFSN